METKRKIKKDSITSGSMRLHGPVRPVRCVIGNELHHIGFGFDDPVEISNEQILGIYSASFLRGVLSGLQGGSVFADDAPVQIYRNTSPWLGDMYAIGDDLRAAIKHVERSLGGRTDHGERRKRPSNEDNHRACA